MSILKKNKTSTASEHVMDLEDSIDITMVNSYKKGLLTALDSGAAIILKASQVERADTAGIQMLCAFVKDARGKGLMIDWDSPSQTLRNSARLLGLSKMMELS